MQVGRFTIEQLSEGQFEVFSDGKFQKLTPDKDDERRPSIKLPVRVSFTIGIDPVLVATADRNILLDTGLGWGLDHGSRYRNSSNVKSNLSIFGLSTEDITDVILSHLHYDHAAGSTYTDSESVTQPTFPNARYYLQRREWEYAVDQVDGQKYLKGAGYKLDDFYRLVADRRVEMLDEDFYELEPGINILWTGGHTPGHQIVRVYDDDRSVYYLGDLLPSDKHLNHYAMRQLDLHPAQAKKMKVQMLKKVFDEDAFILFYHSLYSKAGRLEKDDRKKYVLKEH